eukprot:CAMPEP_0170128770 /NCGR_PEP_ID=MMETSP0020_2-20130122/21391_1 /TAXON_ID=98059 /ORGANISM="Dinobryon sp., Strain UTEXLB2267" /LENGTH=59 /DNA_ID=CAMNT_0010362799 /DNA_START=901 /DNA_END=1077 /DNA_ORIENTATION=+
MLGTDKDPAEDGGDAISTGGSSGEMKRDPSNGRSEALVDKRLRGNLGNSSASLSKDYLA